MNKHSPHNDSPDTCGTSTDMNTDMNDTHNGGPNTSDTSGTSAVTDMNNMLSIIGWLSFQLDTETQTTFCMIIEIRDRKERTADQSIPFISIFGPPGRWTPPARGLSPKRITLISIQWK